MKKTLLLIFLFFACLGISYVWCALNFEFDDYILEFKSVDSWDRSWFILANMFKVVSILLNILFFFYGFFGVPALLIKTNRRES